MTKLCVFDCDGTLVDSQRSIVACMASAFAVHGHAVPAAPAVRRVVGLPLQEAILELLPGIDAPACALVAQSYSEAFGELRRNGGHDDMLYPGVREALDVIETAGWVLGVATGKSRRGLLATLDGYGLTERFVSLQTSDLAPGKPHPDMILRAMADTGADPARTVMVGDTTYDILMARSAGTVAVGVAWGYHEGAELKAAGAHTIVDDFADLPGTIERLIDGA